MTPHSGEPRLIVRGGGRLTGQIPVSGAKNSALKLMAASLLAPGVSVLHNVPDIQDVLTMREVLEHLGAVVSFADSTMTVDTTRRAVARRPLRSRATDAGFHPDHGAARGQVRSCPSGHAGRM